MSEERDDIVVLVDEDGVETEFEHLDTVELNGNEYVVLMPLIDEEGSEEADYVEEGEVVILKVDYDENGEESYVSIDDEDELDEVFEEFKARMEDEYDFFEE
ncbi:MAG TPA: DUF1292 domain-containing protein [Clostridiaceae bacterium]|jgi:uncharacterized protein YrzB (UPF0473 family)|nr:DUF1292 domain-containing protein [Clostridiaceae bacterium]